MKNRWRKYKTASGFWGFGLGKSNKNWWFQFGNFVFTNEP